MSAWDRLQGSNVPPWEKPWDLHQITAGASGQFPWVASLLVSETKISRDDADSLADHLVGLGLASPQQRLVLNGAWSSSRQNPSGGFALGAKWMQPINSARLELTLRQRSKDWVPAWDPTYYPDAEVDSSALLGAGEGIASLRIPFHAADGRGAVTSET